MLGSTGTLFAEVVRMRGLCCGWVPMLTALACGGGTAGGEAEGMARSSPTKDGVPIGDCVETTSSSRPPGCPAEPPEPLSACEASSGTVHCPYEIEAQAGRAGQNVFVCTPEQSIWGQLQVACGQLCQAPHANVLELGESCSDRAITTCEDSDIVFAFETAQQWLDRAFERVLVGCYGEQRFSKLFLLELVNGCPSRFSSNVPIDPSVAECMRRGLSVRWACALDLSCTQFSAFPL